MTTEPVAWYISAADSTRALRVLQDVDKKLLERTHAIEGAQVDRWPGYEIRVYVSDTSRLLADPEHGDAIHKLTERLVKHGRRAGVLLALDWSA
jgi:hypothetical protein